MNVNKKTICVTLVPRRTGSIFREVLMLNAKRVYGWQSWTVAAHIFHMYYDHIFHINV